MELRLKGQIKAAEDAAIRLDKRILLQKKTAENEKIIVDKITELLETDAASDSELSAQENRFIQALQTLENLQNEKQSNTDQAEDLRGQYNLLAVTEQQEISDIETRISSIDQRITRTRGEEQYVITAPISGRLASITAREGQVANPQRAIATLLPEGGELEAELLVPSRAAGFVKEGQTVRVFFDAFPYQKFGFHTGRISKVSRAVINVTDLPIAPNIQEPVFVVTVQLERQYVDANNETYLLQSGMTVAAEIILEERKIWEWVFEPILGTLN